LIKVQDFVKNYYTISQKEPVFSVSGINFQINKGEICGLLGPNGSGKTTIIKALCGFHNPSEGNVTITAENQQSENPDLHSESISANPANLTNPENLMEKIGYVPEISILPPEMKVIDFLFYVASIHEKTMNNQQEAVESVIKKCELSKVVNKKIKSLSKGYKQRVSFAQAIIHNPDNLILDEPISGLDPAQIVQMRALIKELAATKAVLISTHILQEVTSLCNRVFIINEGLLVAEGTEKEITQKQNTSNFEEAFIKLTSEIFN